MNANRFFIRRPWIPALLLGSTACGDAEDPDERDVDTRIAEIAAGAYQQGSDASGLVVIESEHYSALVSQGDHSWVSDMTAGYSGDRAMRATPNVRTNVNTGYLTQSPRLDFQVNFLRTGTHHVWVRGYAPPTIGNNDSCHVGLDGE